MVCSGGFSTRERKMIGSWCSWTRGSKGRAYWFMTFKASPPLFQPPLPNLIPPISLPLSHPILFNFAAVSFPLLAQRDVSSDCGLWWWGRREKEEWSERGSEGGGAYHSLTFKAPPAQYPLHQSWSNIRLGSAQPLTKEMRTYHT